MENEEVKTPPEGNEGGENNDANDLSKVVESVNSIGEVLQQVTSKIESLEEKFNAAEPEPAVEPPKTEEPAWQPKSWDDIPKLVEEKGKEIAEQTIEARDKAAREAEEARAAEVKQIDEEFDRQLEDLEGKNIIPKIQNAEDPNDPGRQARKELFGRAAALKTVDLISVGNDLHELHQAGFSYDPAVNKVIRSKPNVAGMNSPVGSSSSRGYSGAKSAPSYKELHEARSMDELVSRFEQA
jgi:hypothetical protein